MKTPKSLTDHEVLSLLSSLSHDRDYTMALFMLDAGLRVGELVQLRQGDLFYAGVCVQHLTIRPEIAKGKVERGVPMSPRLIEAVNALRTHVWYAEPWIRNHYAFYVHDAAEPISIRTVQRIIADASSRFTSRKITPHMLRHTFAARVLRKSNLRVTQELLGHKRVSSTQIYTQPNNQDLRKAVDAACC